jgi:uncharacterized membrane protein
MPFCASCGSDVQGKFCAKCGTAVAAAPPPPAYAPPPPAAYTPPPPSADPYNPQGGYVPPQAPPQAYAPPPQGGYVPPQQGYAPPQQSYAPPPPQGGYAPPPGGGYNPPPPGGGYNPPPPGYGPPPSAQPAGMTENMACALCYLLGWLTGVLFLVLEPYNRNKTIRFHAFQSIFMCIALFAVYIVLFIISGVLLLVPFIGAAISVAIHLILGFGTFALWLFLMYKAYNNERFVLPIIGPLAEKQA